MTPWVVDLHDPAAADPALAGGKAAALHHMTAAGLPVPDAFVITTAAFQAHFPAVTTTPPASPKLLDPLASAITAALRRRFDPGERLAVRSSAVGEDSPQASFAGQHATYYYVAPEALAQSVVDCWLSLWSAPAVAYRARLGGTAVPAMAVVVQRMVAAVCSGVCFTADPTGRHPGQVMVEATWGLGAALVDGRVSPDRFILDREGRLIQRHVARKLQRVAAAPGDTRLEPVPLEQQIRATLSKASLTEVLRRSLQAEALFGSPQDVEWAYAGGVLHLLQSRPVTLHGAAGKPSAPTAGERPPGGAKWVLFKPLAENFTEPLTPMSVDLFRRVLPPLGRFIDGRYYLNVHMVRRLCPFRWSERQLIEALLLRGEVPALRWDWRKAPLAALAFAAAYLLDGISWHRSAHLDRAALNACERLCVRLRLSRAHDARSVIERLMLGRHPLEPLGRLPYYVNVSAGRYFLLLGLLDKLVQRYAPDFDPARLSQLCTGDGHTFSRQLVEGVRALAETAKRDPELAARLSGTVPSGVEAIASLPENHPFVLALERFLETFGHRGLREMELAVPRWREDPLPVLLMARGHLRAPAPPAGDPHALQLATRDAVRHALPRTWQRRLAGWLMERISHYTALREDTRHYHAMATDVARSKLLDLEQALLADGRLRVPGDVFYLTWEEARALERRELTWTDVAGDVRDRRRRHQLRSRGPGAEVLGDDGLDLTGAAATALDATRVTLPAANGGSPPSLLTGHCASPGTAEGRVRIIMDPAAGNALTAGDVLVAPYTDPAWTPLFPLAAAVVVEVGSFLSHAGTVAREYGIPCLVDVAGCTRLLRDGQRIRVAADDGRVEVLEP